MVACVRDVDRSIFGDRDTARPVESGCGSGTVRKTSRYVSGAFYEHTGTRDGLHGTVGPHAAYALGGGIDDDQIPGTVVRERGRHQERRRRMSTIGKSR